MATVATVSVTVSVTTAATAATAAEARTAGTTAFTTGTEIGVQSRRDPVLMTRLSRQPRIGGDHRPAKRAVTVAPVAPELPPEVDVLKIKVTILISQR